MILRYILDMCSVSKRMTTIIFFNFNKAFDSIDRCAISIVLSKYGVSELLIANVIQFYIGASAVVFSFPKSVMLTRCAFLKPWLKQLQHMDWNQSP